MSTLLVTGSSGLIGSEVVSFFCAQGWQVHGIDNNQRADFFGPEGDTRWNLARLLELHDGFTHHDVDIRDRKAILDCVKRVRPDLLVHAAAQPSHDLAARRPFDDFDINAGGTLNLLEATRCYAHDAVFVFMSTNKVYGDRPNQIPLVEQTLRWEYDDPAYANGIPETLSVDHSTHSVFGASKAAADLMVQEYARYFGLASCCLRAGCLTGPNHSGVTLHGFLSYLIRCNVYGATYRVVGYKGKQVRDNLHSLDVARFIQAFWEHPRPGTVYNLGGGRENSCSILEAFRRIEHLTGRPMQWTYDETPRRGDHICYISDLSSIQRDFPGWAPTKSLDDIFAEIHRSWIERAARV